MILTLNTQAVLSITSSVYQSTALGFFVQCLALQDILAYKLGEGQLNMADHGRMACWNYWRLTSPSRSLSIAAKAALIQFQLLHWSTDWATFRYSQKSNAPLFDLSYTLNTFSMSLSDQEIPSAIFSISTKSVRLMPDFLIGLISLNISLRVFKPKLYPPAAISLPNSSKVSTPLLPVSYRWKHWWILVICFSFMPDPRNAEQSNGEQRLSGCVFLWGEGFQRLLSDRFLVGVASILSLGLLLELLFRLCVFVQMSIQINLFSLLKGRSQNTSWDDSSIKNVQSRQRMYNHGSLEDIENVLVSFSYISGHLRSCRLAQGPSSLGSGVSVRPLL